MKKPQAKEPMVRFCPIGPGWKEQPVCYAWCTECERVRKSNKPCYMIPDHPVPDKRTEYP